MKIIWTITLIATLGFPTALMGHEMGRDVKVKQEPGKTVYWVLPGPRRLSERVFGVPGHPLRTGELSRLGPGTAGHPAHVRERGWRLQHRRRCGVA